jgi:hypothetical protein
MPIDLVTLGRQVAAEYTKPMGRNGRPLTGVEMLALHRAAVADGDERIAANGCCGERDGNGYCLSGGLCPLVEKALRMIGG